MLAGLADSTILIDILRGYKPAQTWLRAQGQVELGITPIVWMEIIGGTTNHQVQSRARKALRQFQIVYLTQSDFNWDMQQQLTYQLSHGAGFWDCLIASVNHRLQIPLYTANLKRFAPLLGSLAQQPY